MESKEGVKTSEWKGYLTLVASMLVTVGGALLAKGVIGENTVAAVIVTSLIAIAGAYIRYNDGRVKVKVTEALERAAVLNGGDTSDP